MLYSEFKNTYKSTLKKYPSISYMFNDEPIKNITMKTTSYEKHGSKWIEVEETTKTVDFIHYTNVVDAVPFFRNLGGSETVTKAYTKYGLIPIKIVSTSPDKQKRTVYRFEF